MAAGPLVWGADGVVRLSDGTSLDLGGPPSSYVVAGDGAFFVPAASPEEAETGSNASGEVHFVTPEGDATDTALVAAVDGTLAIDLATGDTSDADPTKVPVPGSPESPDGAWTIRQDGDRATVLGAGGDALPLEIEAPQWTLDWWADAETAVGVALNADGSSALLSCPVPEGTWVTRPPSPPTGGDSTERSAATPG